MELKLRTKKYWPLFFIALAFAAPFILAQIALIFQQELRRSTSSMGHLLDIPEQLIIQKFETLLPNNNTSHPSWQLVFVTPTDCTTECLARQQALKQLHALLRDDKNRVQLISAHVNDIIPNKSAGNILLIDPYGQHIMYYDQTMALNGILKDLMRLLKYSNV